MHLIHFAKYAVAKSVENEPVFNWWVHCVLKKRDQIIPMVRKCSTKYFKKTHKFGLKLPKMVNEVYPIDKKNSNTLWQDAIQKEIENVKIAFQIIPEAKKPPNGFQHAKCHMMFHA